MTEDGLLALWAYMAEVWPNYKLPSTEELFGVRQQVWFDLLGDFEDGEVRVAIVRCSDREFAPPPGELRQVCAQLRAEFIDGELIPDAAEAWGELKRKIGSVGRMGSPEWSHPIVASTVDALGWQSLCDSTDPEGVLRGQFMKLFDSVRSRFESRLAGPTGPELEYQREVLEGPKRMLGGIRELPAATR